MTTVFVSGSMKIKNLDGKVMERLQNILEAQYDVIVGDADGVDSSVQEYFKEHNFNSVFVYCSGEKPRNNIGHWVTRNISAKSKPGTRDYFTEKDKKMAEDCDYGFMVWDARSTGTLNNALELVSRKKIALVYINKVKKFVKVKGAEDIDSLVSFMSIDSLKKADEKIGLRKKIDAIKYLQQDIFAAQQGVAPDPHASASLRRGVG